METSSEIYATLLKERLKPLFPFARVRIVSEDSDRIRATLYNSKGVTEQDQKNFNYAIRGHMDIGFVGVVVTPTEEIVFE